MSIRDKIRDQLYGSTEDERKSEERAPELSDLGDTVSNPFAAAKLLGACILVEERRSLFRSLRETGYGTDGGEGRHRLGFLRLFHPRFFGVPILEVQLVPAWAVNTSDDMPAFTDYDRGEPKMAMWFVSAGGGVLNTLFFFVLHSLWN